MKTSFRHYVISSLGGCLLHEPGSIMLFTSRQDCSRRNVVIRCTCCSCCFPHLAGCIETTQTTLTRYFSDEPFFPFSCDRFLIVCPWFFFSTCVFVKKIPSNRGEALFLMYHFRSQFCGLKTGKWGLRDLFLPHFLRLLSAIISTMLSNIEVKVK